MNLTLAYLLRHLPTYLQPRIHTGRSQKENDRCDIERRLSSSAVYPPHKACLHTIAVEACHDLSCMNTFGALAKPLLPIPRYHRYRYTAQLKPTNCNRCTNCPSASVFIPSLSVIWTVGGGLGLESICFTWSNDFTRTAFVTIDFLNYPAINSRHWMAYNVLMCR